MYYERQRFVEYDCGYTIVNTQFCHDFRIDMSLHSFLLTTKCERVQVLSLKNLPRVVAYISHVLDFHTSYYNCLQSFTGR